MFGDVVFRCTFEYQIKNHHNENPNGKGTEVTHEASEKRGTYPLTKTQCHSTSRNGCNDWSWSGLLSAHDHRSEKREEMKIAIEYNIVGDGRKFLNFWDSLCGADVVCEIRNEKIFLDMRDSIPPEKEISIHEFLNLVEQNQNASIEFIRAEELKRKNKTK